MSRTIEARILYAPDGPVLPLLCADLGSNSFLPRAVLSLKRSVLMFWLLRATFEPLLRSRRGERGR